MEDGKEFYKLKHKPTGLFYKPSKFKSANLSQKGEVYIGKPTFKLCKTIYLSEDVEKNRWNPKVTHTLPHDWEIVVYRVSEAESIPLK